MRKGKATKRVIDENYSAYCARTAVTSKIDVKCPSCGGHGMVTADEGAGIARFKCTNCGSMATEKCVAYRYHVANRCQNCGRYYRVSITEKKNQHFSILNAPCPYCRHIMPGSVHKTATALSCYSEIENACEPFFGYELWFLSHFKDKPVWAVNRGHLNYLIDYLSADLREKPAGFPLRKQADHLPAFMKTAKNRERIVKLLKNMQEK